MRGKHRLEYTGVINTCYMGAHKKKGGGEKKGQRQEVESHNKTHEVITTK